MLVPFSRFLRCLTFVALAAMGLGVSHARADVADVLKEIQQDGEARVLLRMKADRGPVPWAPRLSASRQRVAVATAMNEAAPALARARLASVKQFRTLPYVAATVTREQVMALVAEDAVDGIFLVRRERRADVGGIAQVQAITLTAAQESVDLASAWARGYDGAGYAIAVIDSGINVNHPALLGKNVGDACFANTFGTTTVAECPSQFGAGAASYCPAGSDRCDHGTHVASVAVGNDGSIFGIARGAKLVPIDIFSKVTDADTCSPDPAPCLLTDSLAVLNALDYVNEHAVLYGIAAVNLSIGGTARDGYCDDDPRKGVIDMLRQKGVGVAVAASNGGLTGQITSPACISSAISVGATDNGTTVASFSNFANTLDFVAPGISVQGALASGGYTTRSGTSMSTPQVAGAWTILRQAFPTLSSDAIETALKQTGVPVTRGETGISVAKIQIGAALTKLLGSDRKLFNNIFTAGGPIGDSLLRFFNASDEVGNVKVTLRDAGTSAYVGEWISPPIPANGSLQFTAKSIEANATANGLPVPHEPRAYFNVEVVSSFPGYVQHVVWNSIAGALTNLTTCGAMTATDNVWQLINVHSTAIQMYPSRIRLVNTGAAPVSPTLTFSNAVTGEKVAEWTSPEIPTSGSYEVTVPYLEAVVPALAEARDAGVAHYNVSSGSFSGYLQHVVENLTPDALVDMTAKCRIGDS